MSLLSPSQQTAVAGLGELDELAAAGAHVEGCCDCLAQPQARESLVDAMCRRVALRALNAIEDGGIFFCDAGVAYRVGADFSDAPTVEIHSPRAWRSLVFGGSLAVAESYLRGDWDADDLVRVMRVLARNSVTLRRLDDGWSQFLGPLRRVAHWLRRNTKAGSRRNIAAHYDLSNDFFALMLDRSMAYSAGVFESPNSTLEQASLAKFERICRQLRLSPRDHLLEIGCGWGGLAIYAAEHYGCRVTATTISQQQYEHAQKAIQRAGLADRITLLLKDYRELNGRFDKLASIEMIEAVGEQYLDSYFDQCGRLLKPDGLMLLQAITMPEARYDRYRRDVDFIQQYIFPGGFLPSISAISASLRRAADLEVVELWDFAQHYAQTLNLWRQRFWQHIDDVRLLGFDERFIRMWHYYLCYCEAGFHERMTGVSHILLAKPNWRSCQ